jgi:DNA-binding LacI/PurR family transcriptional regulator
MKKRLPKAVQSTAELAARLGLSRWTVSRVLNQHPGIHQKTRERVERGMAKYNFAPSAMARGLRGGRTGTVGICIQELENFNLVSKVSTLNEKLRSHGLHGLLEFSDGVPDLEAAIVRRFIAMRVDGVVFFGSVLPRRHAAFTALREAGIPFVPIDPFDGSLPGAISVDRGSAMRQVATHLLGLGHRKFVSLGIDPSSPYGRIRMKALELALHSRHATLLPLFGSAAPRMDFEYGRRLAERLIAKTKPPCAIIAVNDRLAFGAMEFLKRKGFEVPSDFSVCGYDNSDLSAFASPSLTSVDAQPDALIEKAQERLLSQLAASPKGETRTAEFPGIRIEPKLIVRDSTAPPAKPRRSRS